MSQRAVQSESLLLLHSILRGLRLVPSKCPFCPLFSAGDNRTSFCSKAAALCLMFWGQARALGRRMLLNQLFQRC